MASNITEVNDEQLSPEESRYELLDMIDYGSFGDIFKVKNEENNLTYALKQIRFRGDFRDDPYIISEIYCLTHLKHKNVVQMHEIIIEDNEIDIIMEYAERENLERFLTEQDSVEFLVKFKIYAQILEGVKYCHSMDIAHRDLTPVNILLTEDMVVKIADFGLAVKCFDADGEPMLCTDYLGRCSYLPHEVLAQTPFLPKPADIWSLGVILLFLLFRSIPYAGLEQQIISDQMQHSWKTFIEKHLLELSCTMKNEVLELLSQILVLEPTQRSNICDIVRIWDDIGPESCFKPISDS